MARSDFPELEAEARRILEVLRVERDGVRAKGLVVTVVVADAGRRGGIAYLSNGDRDSMISALEELVANMKTERRHGEHAPTIVEAFEQLRQAARDVLQVPEGLNDEEALRRVERLARLVGVETKPGAHA